MGPRLSCPETLLRLLADRKSTREFGRGTLSPQTLSNLLWAAFGINRQDGRRTAPSAMNWQEVSIYVATSEGVYIYDAKDNALDPVLAGDFRAATGTQAFVKDAAVNLPSLRFCDLLDQPSHSSEWTASEDSP